MQCLRIILPSRNPYTAPLHVAAKKDPETGDIVETIPPSAKSLFAILTHCNSFHRSHSTTNMSSANLKYQRLINERTNGLPHVFAYADDILVASNDLVDHMNALAELFTLEKFELRSNFKKCQWIQHQIDVLGFTITSEGIKAQTAKTQTLSELQERTDYKELSECSHFIGNIYTHYAHIVEPHQQLLNVT